MAEEKLVVFIAYCYQLVFLVLILCVGSYSTGYFLNYDAYS